MVEFDIDSLKTYSEDIAQKFVLLIKTILEIKIVSQLKGHLTSITKTISEEPIFESYGITQTKLLALILIFIGLTFLVFGKKLIRLQVSLFGYGLGVFFVYITLSALPIQMEGIDSSRVLLIVLLSAISGLIWARLFYKMFHVAFYACFFCVYGIFAYKISTSIAHTLTNHFALHNKTCGVFFLRVHELDPHAIPLLGLVAVHVFLFLVALALASFHSLLPLLAMSLYALASSNQIPLDFHPFAQKLAQTAQKSVGVYQLPAEAAVALAVAAVLAFELLAAVRHLRLSTALALVTTAAAALLAGCGAEMLFREAWPEWHSQVAFSDDGLGVSVSLVSLLTTAVCVFAGLAVQLK